MLGKRNTQMKIIDAIKRNSNIILYLSLFSRQSSLGKWTLTLCVFGVHFSNGHFVALLLIPLKSVPLLLLLQCNTFAMFNSLTNTTSQGWRFRFLKVCRNVILLHISEDLDQTLPICMCKLRVTNIVASETREQYLPVFKDHPKGRKDAVISKVGRYKETVWIWLQQPNSYDQ